MTRSISRFAGSMLLCGVGLMAIPALLPAKEFPLEFKTLNAKEAMAFPGGYGSFGPFTLAKPGQLKKEPAAVSGLPLYGQFQNGFLFRLDESNGDGKGYDLLIIDRNQNGDLTDDEVIRAPNTPEAHRAPRGGFEEVMFGPIEMPVKQITGNWRPIYFAQMYLYNRTLISKQPTTRQSLGQLTLKAGWYLETMVEMEGIKQKVGIVDGNVNMRLGDRPKAQIYRSTEGESWFFLPADSWLQDVNGSGQFENDQFGAESSPFGSILYFGAIPYKITLSQNCKSIVIEPWSTPLAELVIQPHGDQVCTVTLAWEDPVGQWQLIKLGVANGKAQVPPGNYRLYTCMLKATNSAGDSLILSSSKRSTKDTTQAAAGVPTPFKCGSPLEIKVTSQRVRTAGSDQPLQQLIQASVTGAGGESYTSFFLEDKNKRGRLPEPTFTVITADGKQVASGNLEFG